nr:response regulator [Geotalea toluenoxydans]
MVVGEAADGTAAVELTQKLKPDLVLMDLMMPIMDGLTAIEEIMAHSPTRSWSFLPVSGIGTSTTPLPPSKEELWMSWPSRKASPPTPFPPASPRTS